MAHAPALLQRRPDWPERLAQWLQAMRDEPFAWGRNDCVRFVCAAIEQMTGTDPWPRVTWVDRAGALRALRGLGGLRAAITQRLGPPLPSPAWAQRGDVLLLRGAATVGRPAAGLCVGAHWAGPGPCGVVQGPMSMALAAWPVWGVERGGSAAHG